MIVNGTVVWQECDQTHFREQCGPRERCCSPGYHTGIDSPKNICCCNLYYGMGGGNCDKRTHLNYLAIALLALIIVLSFMTFSRHLQITVALRLKVKRVIIKNVVTLTAMWVSPFLLATDCVFFLLAATMIDGDFFLAMNVSGHLSGLIVLVEFVVAMGLAFIWLDACKFADLIGEIRTLRRMFILISVLDMVTFSTAVLLRRMDFMGIGHALMGIIIIVTHMTASHKLYELAKDRQVSVPFWNHIVVNSRATAVRLTRTCIPMSIFSLVEIFTYNGATEKVSDRAVVMVCHWAIFLANIATLLVLGEASKEVALVAANRSLAHRNRTEKKPEIKSRWWCFRKNTRVAPPEVKSSAMDLECPAPSTSVAMSTFCA